VVRDPSELADQLRQTPLRVQQLEHVQRLQAEAHQAMLDALPGHFALLDAHGVIMAVNRSWQRFATANSGLYPDFSIGRNYLLLCDSVTGRGAEEAAAAACCLREVLGRPDAQSSLEYACHCDCNSSAEQRWFRMTATGLGAAGSGGAVVMRVDITGHKRAEALAAQLTARLGKALDDLRAERTQLVAAQAIAKVGNWTVDLISGATQWSDEMHRLLQTDPARATPGLDSYIERVDPAERAAARESFVHSCQQATKGAREHHLLLPDGSSKIVEARWQPVCDQAGRPLRVLGTCQDITERRHAEQQLLENKSVLRMAARLAGLGAWQADLATDAFRPSDEVCALLEVAPGTLTKVTQALAFVTPEWAAPAQAAITACVNAGTPFDLEIEILTGRGRRVWVHAIGEAVPDLQGTAGRMQGALQDLTERKQAEHETRQLAGHLSDTIESLTDVFYTVDREWRFTHANAKALTMTALKREQLIGRVLWDVVPIPLGSPFEERLRHAMNERVATLSEDYFAGWNAWLSTRAFPSEAGLTVHVRDVTAERAARQHLELLEASISQLHDMVLIIEWPPDDAAELKIIFVNDAVLRNTGYSRAELIGNSPEMLNGPGPDPQAFVRLREQVGRGRPAHLELAHYRKDGEVFWTEVDISPVCLDSNATSHVVSVGRDITDRKRNQDALQELNADLEARVLARTADLNLAREEAERANRAKSAFLATMSHEIRTPMNGVMGMIDVLHQTSLKGYQVEMVDLIRDSADTLMAIVDDILDFSKIEAGKLQIEQVPMQLADAVEKVCAMIDHIAVKRGVRTALFVDPALPRILGGDETRVRQVLLNLCNNAIKFSSGPDRTGEMSVRVTLLSQDDEGVNVELAVADNGIGMDEAVIARLFTPFSQAEGSTTRRFGGTGLGLAITHQLVSLMGGEIAVRSAPGAGSTFSVRLRFARVDDARNKEPTPAVSGLHCRIVGNELPLANDLGAYLTHAGVEVEQMATLAAAAAAPTPAGMCVWLILPGQDIPDLAALRAMAPGRCGDEAGRSETRFVVLGRGARRRLRVEAVDLVTLDADAILRSTLIKAISVASGRAPKALAIDIDEPSNAGSQAPPRHEALAQGRLILVAEDNETNRMVIVRQLALLGYAADVVVNGREALDHWRTGDYALLLTDLHMPEMDGYLLAAAIRAEESMATSGHRMPIVALTANVLNDEAQRCIAVGIDVYLTKPIRLSPLRQVLERWLSKPAASGVAAATPPVPASSVLPVDLSVLVALVGDDSAVLRRVLRTFRASADQLAGELRVADELGLHPALAAVAHKMKSGARAIGAGRLGEVCAAIEQAGGGEAMHPLLIRLQNELQAVLVFLDHTEEFR
jgi:PAS domain S-box-containing protein